MSSSISFQTVKKRRSSHCTILYHGSTAAMMCIRLPTTHPTLDTSTTMHSTCGMVAQAMRLGQPLRFRPQATGEPKGKGSKKTSGIKPADKDSIVYKVKEILQIRMQEGGKKEYQVWWENFPKEEEPESRAKTLKGERETKRSRSLKRKGESNRLKRWRRNGPKVRRSCPCSLCRRTMSIKKFFSNNSPRGRVEGRSLMVAASRPSRVVMTKETRAMATTPALSQSQRVARATRCGRGKVQR